MELEIWEFGGLGTWKSRNLESTQNEKYKNKNNFKIEIRSAQNADKVWICRGKPQLTLSHTISQLFHGAGKYTTYLCFAIFLGGPLAAIQPVWVPCCYPPLVELLVLLDLQALRIIYCNVLATFCCVAPTQRARRRTLAVPKCPVAHQSCQFCWTSRNR